jgi:muramidase (phage lysozyme)
MTTPRGGNPRERYEQLLGNENVNRLLHTISWAEGTPGEAGYQTMFGGGRFQGSQHPRQVVNGGRWKSDAAGKYQFLSTTWDGVAKELGLKDFSPRNQDLAALRLIERRGVRLEDVAARGIDPGVIDRLAPEWASLPTKAGKSYYGQPVKPYSELEKRFRGAPAGGAKPTGLGKLRPGSLLVDAGGTGTQGVVAPLQSPTTAQASESQLAPFQPLLVSASGDGGGKRDWSRVQSLLSPSRPAGAAFGLGPDDVDAASAFDITGLARQLVAA